MPCRLAQPLPYQQKYCFSLVFGGDGTLKERALCVEFRQSIAERFRVFVFRALQSVLREGRQHAMARKHAAARQDGRRGESVNPNPRRQRHSELMNKMVGCGLARIIRKASFLRDHRIYARGEHHAAGKSLSMPDLRSHIGYQEGACHIDRERLLPCRIRHEPVGIRAYEKAGGYDNMIQATKGQHDGIQRMGNRRPVRDVTTQANDVATSGNSRSRHAYTHSDPAGDGVLHLDCRLCVQIHGRDLGPCPNKPIHHLPANATGTANNGHNPP